uniref:Uncharacterized protein n=1 Tax=Oryza glumipatula TaxID=40148 RepID=A0A0E0ABW4_9ORYZ
MEPLSLDPMAGGVERSATANTSTSFVATSHHLALRASLLHHRCQIRRMGKGGRRGGGGRATTKSLLNLCTGHLSP